MRAEFLILFLVVGVGTYLTRFLPLLLALRRDEAGGETGNPSSRSEGGLRFVGPSIIAALLVASVLPEPEQGDWAELVRTALALAPTVLVAIRFRNSGLTVLVGVFAYWLVSFVV